MLKFIIVDDEPLAHEILEEFCSMIPDIILTGNFFNAMDALQFLNKHEVDFMFLDINMPKLKGLDFLRILTNPPKVIVTSAYSEFALEGYELNVIDYLLKPIPFDRLLKAVNKIAEHPVVRQPLSDLLQPTNQQQPGTTEASTAAERLFVKGDKKHHQIHLGDLLFIEAYGNYTKLVLEDEVIISHEKISHYEAILNTKNFLRVHKSYMVAVDKIKMIEGNRISIGTHKIPIGQTYKSAVNKLL